MIATCMAASSCPSWKGYHCVALLHFCVSCSFLVSSEMLSEAGVILWPSALVLDCCELLGSAAASDFSVLSDAGDSDDS